VISHCLKIGNPHFQMRELLLEQTLYLPAWGSAGIAHFQNLRQFRQREADRERATDGTNTIQGRGGIEAVVAI